ncbi:MAG: AbrB/MazE/SpoVT family DNA-binding domain-containing protein [Planctomycetota bacterium]|jgi:antitoxin MazE
MRVRLVRIGNSRGIRIPKGLLDQLGLEGDVDLELRDGRLVISPVRSAREGWDKAFAAMAARGDDQLVHGEQLTASAWDEEEWDW